jgi:hypothetical protein
MSSPFTNPLDRRQLLRRGAFGLSMGAIIAACGTNRGGSTDPGRLGVVEPVVPLFDAEVNDIVRARTAQSIEYALLALYEGLGTASLDGRETALFERMVSDHSAHAAQLGQLIGDLGGEQFECANPFIMDRSVTPILDAVANSDEIRRDVLNTSHAFESLSGSAYQSAVAQVESLPLRRELMLIGAEELRHSSAVAYTINPADILSPALQGGPVTPDANGFPIAYAVPSTFGLLTGIDLRVGVPNQDGVRTAIQLQTPAENTFAYEHLSC